MTQCLTDPDSVSKAISFADDVCLYYNHSNIDTLKSELSNSLAIMGRKLHDLGLELSPEKTNLVIFTKKHIDLNDHFIEYENTIIRAKPTAKYLGILLDYRLEWRAHLNEVINNVRKRIHIIKFLRGTYWGGHPKTLTIFYKSYVRGYIDYSSVILINNSNKQMKKFETMQRVVLRHIFGYRMSTPNGIAYAESKIPLLHLRFQKTTRKFELGLISYENN